jgi:molybdopterin-binding protein
MSLETPGTARIFPRYGWEMEDLIRIGAAAQAIGVSIDTLRRWERDGRVTFERRGGQRFLRADALAELLKARGPAGRTSARNRLTGTVLAVEVDGVMAKIDLMCGQYRIVSLMSREAAEDLALKPGDSAAAVVKATTVIIERD